MLNNSSGACQLLLPVSVQIPEYTAYMIHSSRLSSYEGYTLTMQVSPTISVLEYFKNNYNSYTYVDLCYFISDAISLCTVSTIHSNASARSVVKRATACCYLRYSTYDRLLFGPSAPKSIDRPTVDLEV